VKNLLAWFADNHVAANLLMFLLVIGGIVTALTIKIEIFPELEMDVIQVTIVYPGASPAEVEEGILRHVEEAVAGITGIRTLESTARENYGTVTIEVDDGFDVKEVLDDVKAEVDRITTLPEEAEKPIVSQLTRKSRVISVAIYGDVPEITIKRISERIRDEITDLPDVTVADLSGPRPEEIHIEISEATLRKYGLTLGKVAKLVSSASLDLPAGSVKTSGGEILVRTKGRRYHADEYKDIAVLTRPDGTVVTLGQIATLRDGFADTDVYARFNGKPAAVIQVSRVADQNALTVAAEVKQYIAKVRPQLPAGVHISVYSDRSRVLKSRLRLLLRNMAMGLVLVAVLLGVFLNLRLAFWVTLGIPISFLAGIWALPHMDVSINMISLFAFIMVLGIVVDDAIVVGESVYTKREEGMSPLKAAVEGTLQIARPVIFSVLTTVVAFYPLLLASGAMGKMMRNIPLVVIVVLLASLAECLFILPAHLARSRFGDNRGSTRLERKAAAGLQWVIQGPYRRLLDFCLEWRYATVALGLALLLVCLGFWTSGIMKFTLFPKVDSDVLQAAVVMPTGTPVEHTLAVVKKLEQGIRDALHELDQKRGKDAEPLFKYTATIVGMAIGSRHGPNAGATELGGHLATMYVEVLPSEKRGISSAKLVKLWRQKVGPVPDAREITYQGTLFSAGNPIEVDLSSDNHAELTAAAKALKAELRKHPGIFDVGDSFLPGKQEIQLKLKPSARALGLTLSDLALQVRHAFYGAEALRLQRDKDEVKVLVRFPEKERHSLSSLESMRIRTPDGKELPFSQVAEVSLQRGYSTISRSQRRRVVKVMADVDEKTANAAELRKWLEIDYLPRLLDQHPGLRYTMEGEGREQAESMAGVFEGFAIAMFAIYALLAVPFRSFTQPFIVMLAIPFGIVGAILGHLVMGLNLTLLSMFGIVGLSGVVVNDSLVLIHRANALREEGASALEAIRQAGPMRFRAIILTSLTTFAGLAPMITERSLQAQFLIPMAVSLGFGVLFATVITLLLVPCAYLILEDITGWFRRVAMRFGYTPRASEEPLEH